jgi:hypothetical protein
MASKTASSGIITMASNTGEVTSKDDDSFVKLKSKPTTPSKRRPACAKCKSFSVFKSLSTLLRRSSREREPAFDTLGGVFANDLASSHFSTDCESSDSTLNPRSSIDSQWTAWSSSGSALHLSQGPRFGLSSSKLVVQEKNENLHLSEHEIWGRLILRARKLPKQAPDFQNNHMMINGERTKRFTPALCRSRYLDELAQEHAKKMAESAKLFHPETAAVLDRAGATSRVATNVSRGSTLKSIHAGLMESLSDKNNILDRHFSYMGIGTAKATDGTLYLCQLFHA